MSPDREAALRDLLTAIIGILDVPRPAHSGDDDLYLHALLTHIDSVDIALRALVAGVMDNTQVQETGRVLRLVAADLPVSYVVAS